MKDDSATRVESGSGPAAESAAAGPERKPAAGRRAHAQRRPWPWVVGLGVAIALSASGVRTADSVFTAFLIVGLPVLAAAQLRVLGDEPVRRIPAYLGSIVAMIVLAGVAALLGVRKGGWESLWIVSGSTGTLVAWSLGLTLAGVAVVLVFHGIRLGTGTSESRHLKELLPRTPVERAGFFGLSFSAGFGEELVFRGYLIAVLGSVLSSDALAAVAAALVFGAVHAYQEWVGMVRASLLGLLMSLPVLILGNLWPAMVAHTLIDLVGGFVLRDRLAPDG